MKYRLLLLLVSYVVMTKGQSVPPATPPPMPIPPATTNKAEDQIAEVVRLWRLRGHLLTTQFRFAEAEKAYAEANRLSPNIMPQVPRPPAHPIEAPFYDIGAASSKKYHVYTQLYGQIATYGALMGLDYHSTSQGIRNGRGREANPFLSCGGGNLCVGRFVALNAAAGAGVAIVGRFVAPALPPTPRRIVNGMIWAMLGGRAVVVVRNYRLGGER